MLQVMNVVLASTFLNFSLIPLTLNYTVIELVGPNSATALSLYSLPTYKSGYLFVG